MIITAVLTTTAVVAFSATFSVEAATITVVDITVVDITGAVATAVDITEAAATAVDIITAMEVEVADTIATAEVAALLMAAAAVVITITDNTLSGVDILVFSIVFSIHMCYEKTKSFPHLE
jgi:hypothetical protein